MVSDIKESVNQETSIEAEEQSFKYLKEFKNQAEINKDEKAREALKTILQFATQEVNIQVTLGLYYKYDFCGIIIKCLSSEHQLLNTNSKLTVEALELTSDCVELIRIFSYGCVNFCNDFVYLDGLDVLFRLLKDEQLLQKYIELNESDKDGVMFSTLDSIIRGSISCLINVSKTYSKNFHLWRKEENGITSYLLSLSIRLKHVGDCELALYTVIALIADDNEIIELPCLDKVVKRITQIIGSLCDQWKESDSIKRVWIHLNKTESTYHAIGVIKVNGTVWNLFELTMALYHIATNDHFKYEIYEENKMKDYLRVIIYNGNEIESKFGIKLLWQLCFDRRISQHVKNDTELMSKIEWLKDNSSCGYLRKKCEGIWWQINTLSGPEARSVASEDKNEPASRFRINHDFMISYNSQSRELCLKIKKALVSLGYKVWIDVDCIRGSSLESMAFAIESSRCVLMCMTENYKLSANCRAEAEYAFQLNKPIVPLIMQSKYKPDGWLGIILGSKIYIDFTRYEFTHCMNRLKSEILTLNLSQHVEKEPTPSPTSPHHTPQKQQSVDSSPELAENWDEYQVESWLIEKRVNKDIRKNVSPCNGKLLYQMMLTLNEAPDFFYKSVSNNISADIRIKDVVLFTYELKALFRRK